MVLNSADASFIGELDGDLAGQSVGGLGDVNGDGFDDFLIGADGNDEGGENAGQAYLFFGKPDGWRMDLSLSEADASFIGERNGSEAGRATRGIGDVNGDDLPDFIIGASGDDEGGVAAGQAVGHAGMAFHF